MHPIESELSNFTGTEGYTRWSVLFRNCVLTDGAFYLANKAGAFWFMDIIGSILAKIIPHEFAVCKIERDGKGGATFTADDGNGKIFYRQQIKYTDAQFDYKVFAQWGNGMLVVMLPSEY